MKDTDCPTKGCFGFGVTLGDKFSTGTKANIPPAPKLFPTAANDPETRNWAVPFDNVVETKSGAHCRYAAPPTK